MNRLSINGLRSVALVVVALLGLARSGAAQYYDMPQFITPYDETGVGLYLVFVNGIEDVGGMATFRKAGSDVNIGFRGSINDVGGGGDIALNAGLDLYKQFVSASDEFPLDVAWVTGIGLGWVTSDFDDFGILRIPGGVSMSRQLQTDDGKWTLSPYASPRLALDIGLGAADDTELHFDVDLGLEAQFTQSWLLRFGVTVGHEEALGFGIVF